MIKRKTVLILGAGASIPYGFPSGRKLRDIICTELLEERTQLFQAVRAAGFDDDQITRFRDTLRGAGLDSVDQFLERRHEFHGVGVTAIAAALIPFENEQKLNGGDDNWYEYFFQRLVPTKDAVAASNVSVVTFNYDRSLDHFLFTALRKAYGLSTTEAAHFLTDVMPIVHVHGKLGELPDLSGSEDGVHRYHPASGVGGTRAASRRIKVVHQGAASDRDFVRAKSLIDKAEVICFLGFGYLEANLANLQVQKWPQSAELHGTAFGKIGEERAEVPQHFGRGMATLGPVDQSILDYLRYYGILSNPVVAPKKPDGRVRR
jgi:hypothetical protein